MISTWSFIPFQIPLEISIWKELNSGISAAAPVRHSLNNVHRKADRSNSFTYSNISAICKNITVPIID
jgi:hypothetical protein